jgi:uncharacterized protein DUF4112
MTKRMFCAKKCLVSRPFTPFNVYSRRDTGSALVSAFALIQAARLGVLKILLARMSLNILINEFVGIVPVVGDALSFWFQIKRAQLSNHQESHRCSEWRFAQERLEFCYRGFGASLRDCWLRIIGHFLVSPRDRKTAGRLLSR